MEAANDQDAEMSVEGDAREQQIECALSEAEVIVCLSTSEGKLRVQTLPRDEQPDQDSAAVIFAAFLNANLDQLINESLAAHHAWRNPKVIEMPKDDKPLLLVNPRGGFVQ